MYDVLFPFNSHTHFLKSWRESSLLQLFIFLSFWWFFLHSEVPSFLILSMVLCVQTFFFLACLLEQVYWWQIIYICVYIYIYHFWISLFCFYSWSMFSEVCSWSMDIEFWKDRVVVVFPSTFKILSHCLWHPWLFARDV